MSSPRLPLSARPAFLPDEIARREFANVFRGYDPAEVRTFLSQLAEQHAESSDRIAGLQRALIETEERVKNPELDEETVTKLLGEQTTQILRSAREAANEVRNKAEEDISRQLREAHEVTTRMREEAEALLAERTEEAERVANEIRTEAAEQATRERQQAGDDAARLRAETEAEMLALRQQTQADLVDERAKARQMARELIETARAEARALVERTQERQEELLDGLVRKRKIALAQVEELRAGRQRLLKAYKMVRGTLDEVTEELEKVEEEARQAAELAGVRSAQANEIGPDALSTVIELEQFSLEDDVPADVIDLVEGGDEDENSDPRQRGRRDGDSDGGDAGGPGSQMIIDLVDETVDGDDIEVLPLTSGDRRDRGQLDMLQQDEEVIVDVIDDADVAPRSSVSSGLIIGEAYAGAESGDVDRGLKLRREAAIGRFRSQAIRRLKRALQDEQDALASRLRSREAESLEMLLGSADDQASTYQRAIVKLFREVVRTGTTSVDGSTGVERGVVDRTGTVAARGLAEELVEDLRMQLRPVLEELLRMDVLPEMGQLQSRLASPYRALKGAYLEQLVDDRIGGVFDQGVAFARR